MSERINVSVSVLKFEISGHNSIFKWSPDLHVCHPSKWTKHWCCKPGDKNASYPTSELSWPHLSCCIIKEVILWSLVVFTFVKFEKTGYCFSLPHEKPTISSHQSRSAFLCVFYFLCIFCASNTLALHHTGHFFCCTENDFLNFSMFVIFWDVVCPKNAHTKLRCIPFSSYSLNFVMVYLWDLVKIVYMKSSNSLLNCCHQLY